MDVVTTSLEALIQRATNPQNEKPDVAAMEAFCVMLGKESKGVHIASRLLATHVQSSIEKEASQALILLDTCMKRCGRSFHAEIGKFRFLNVMIKLVSPKYLGDKTAVAVRQKILELLYSWMRDYPREVKIKETYEMLKKQGIIKETASPVRNNMTDCTSKNAKAKNPIFEDEEKTKLLQELLRSKDPFDLKLANKLIKTMVKDDEKRVQMSCQRNMELESVHVNVKLLSDMLDSYDPDKSSGEDVELMKELYVACERLKPTVTRLAYESQDNDGMIGEVLAANDELSRVFEKYTSIMVLARGGSRPKDPIANNASLLDLSSPTDSTIQPGFELNIKSSEHISNNPKSDMEMLGDIFSSIGNSPLEASSTTNAVFPDTSIMQPVISILPIPKTKELPSSIVKLDSKAQALEDLNQLGESLLKQSLSQGSLAKSSSLSNVSKSMKDISMKNIDQTLMYVEPCSSNNSFLGAIDAQSRNNTSMTGANGSFGNKSSFSSDDKVEICDFGDLLNNDDDAMLDASPSQIQENRSSTNYDDDKLRLERSSSDREIKPLTDIRVTIDNIKPGTIPPLTVIEEKNGISVVLHFANGSPREDVTVIVVTTMSKNSKALTNYLFQAVVPKQCKCRLEPPSGTELPGHNPFLPPSAITQIMLIANPRKDPLSLKFMLSYTMENETFTEMGEVDKLPKAN